MNRSETGCQTGPWVVLDLPFIFPRTIRWDRVDRPECSRTPRKEHDRRFHVKNAPMHTPHTPTFHNRYGPHISFTRPIR